MTNYLAFQVHGGGIGGGVAANVAKFLEFIESLAGKSMSEIFAAIMPGIANMDNIHPLLVHYPIAFFTVFFLVDVIALAAKKTQWRLLASWLLYLGTIAALFTVVAGLFAADSVEHNDQVHELMESHEHFGVAVLSLAFFLSAWRLKKWGLTYASANGAFLGLSALLCLLLLLGADLGGLMVYQYGVAVKPSAISTMGGDSDGNAASASVQTGHHEHNHGGSNTGQQSGGHHHGGHNHHDHGGHHH